MSDTSNTGGERLSLGYREARQRFLDAATAAGASITAYPHPDHRGPESEEVAIDVAELGPADAASTLVLVSGTHGVEGYAGSALQTHWLTTQAEQRPASVRVVMIHGFNPYGFAWHRRTNEDNVDLNRNFIDWADGPPGNRGYDSLASLLVPDRWDEATKAESTAALLELADQYGIDELQHMITSGQYDHVAGLFYGGTGPVWSHRWLVDNAPALLGDTARLGIIDLHTGLGPWGVGELIVHHEQADPVYERAEAWWGDVHSMRDGDSVSANLSGDWLGRIEDLVPDAELTAAALEFGTVDGVIVLQALRAEAWVHVRSHPGSTEADDARAQVRAAFVDDDPAWLATLITRFDEVTNQALAALD